jgi:hypothetical protein
MFALMLAGGLIQVEIANISGFVIYSQYFFQALLAGIILKHVLHSPHLLSPQNKVIRRKL